MLAGLCDVRKLILRKGEIVKVLGGGKLTADAGVLALSAAGVGHDRGGGEVEFVWWIVLRVMFSRKLKSLILTGMCVELCLKEGKLGLEVNGFYTRQRHAQTPGTHREDPAKPSQTGNLPPGAPLKRGSPQGCRAGGQG